MCAMSHGPRWSVHVVHNCVYEYVCVSWTVLRAACTLRLDAAACTSSGAHRAIGGASPALGSGATALYLGVRTTLQPDPSAAAPPVSCSTFSYSSASISSLRCVTYTTAGDSASSASEASVSRSRSRLCPERPCVGSSRRSSLGRLTRARQSSTSFCWPCERWKKVWLTRPASPAEAAEAEAEAAVQPRGGGCEIRSCRPSRSTSRLASCSWEGVTAQPRSPTESKKPERTTSQLVTPPPEAAFRLMDGSA
mmetsp:Transcript_37694/g.124856  ORF Transcript_37694/g.124856 Transcript_37694/m.124856 type:complete len:251 (+) Transcript_37694:197-949(+)